MLLAIFLQIINLIESQNASQSTTPAAGDAAPSTNTPSSQPVNRSAQANPTESSKNNPRNPAPQQPKNGVAHSVFKVDQILAVISVFSVLVSACL